MKKIMEKHIKKSEKVKLSYNVYPEVKEKIEVLAELLGEKKTDLITEIIENYFKYRPLSADYYYNNDIHYLFSKKDLLKNKKTTSYTNLNKIDIEDAIIIQHYIPNTFDKFNKSSKTYLL